MRCFIAIDTDDPTKKAIALLQQKLITASKIKKFDAKWVEPENIHLTLKFLGDVADQIIPDITAAIDKAARQFSPFDLDIESLGHFGKNSARILWLGTSKSQTLLDLQQNLEENLAQLGFPKENRRFSSHLTLARIKNFSAGRKLAQLTDADDYKNLSLGTISVNYISLYQSQLTQAAPIYTLLSKHNLA